MWHNFVLCVAALAFLFLLPLFLFPVYSTGGGALVTEVVQVSAAGFYMCVNQRFIYFHLNIQPSYTVRNILFSHWPHHYVFTTACSPNATITNKLCLCGWSWLGMIVFYIIAPCTFIQSQLAREMYLSILSPPRLSQLLQDIKPSNFAFMTIETNFYMCLFLPTRTLRLTVPGACQSGTSWQGWRTVQSGEWRTGAAACLASLTPHRLDTVSLVPACSPAGPTDEVSVLSGCPHCTMYRDKCNLNQ